MIHNNRLLYRGIQVVIVSHNRDIGAEVRNSAEKSVRGGLVKTFFIFVFALLLELIYAPTHPTTRSVIQADISS